MIIQLTFSYSETLDKIKRRIEYMAGKRAVSDDDFFRYKACKTDNQILREFMDIALTSVRLAMGSKCVAYDMTADSIIFSVETKITDMDSKRLALASSLQSYMVEFVTAKWFGMMDIDLGSYTLELANNILKLSSESLVGKKASPRKISPI